MMVQKRSKVLSVAQGVMLIWLIGWYIKAYFFFPYFVQVAFEVPVHHALFPAFFESPEVSLFAFLLPMLCLPAILRPARTRLMVSSVIMIVCSLILMGHLNTYNDATFVTSFWVALWLLFLSVRYDKLPDVTKGQACLLARWIMGVIFLAGFIGKSTPEYLSGEAFYNIFWKANIYWPHTWLIANFNEAELMQFSFYFSRMIIATELFLACIPFYTSRHIYWIAPVILAGFTVTNSWAILSVLLCLMGMMVGCWFLSKDLGGDNAKNIA